MTKNRLDKYLNYIQEGSNYIEYLKIQYIECLEKCVSEKSKNQLLRSPSIYASYENTCKNTKCFKIKYLIDQEEKRKSKLDK